MAIDSSAIEELTTVARESGAREARVESLLRDIWSALDPKKHEEIKAILLQILKQAEANYATSYLTYTLLCSMLGVEIIEANKLQKKIEEQALERDFKEVTDRMTIRATASRDLKLQIDGDVVGGDKDEQKK